MSVRFASVRRDQPRQTDDVAPPIAAPVPFWDSVRRGFDDQVFNGNEGGRESVLTTRLAERHREIERLTGLSLPIGNDFATSYRGAKTDYSAFDDPYAPEAAAQAIAAQTLTPRDYEARIEALKQQYPALRGIPGRQQVEAASAAELTAIRRRASEASDSGWLNATGTFVGGAAGGIIDLPNLIAGLATGGLGAARPLVTRMAVQGVAGGLTEAGQVPARAEAARQFGGPEYRIEEAAGDIAGGAVGPAGIEALAAGGRAAWRATARQFGGSADPAARGVADAIDQIDADEAAIGDAPDFDAARQAMAAGGAPPVVEPERSLEELFATPTDVSVSGPVRPTQPGALAEGVSGGDRLTQPGLQSADYMGRTIYAGRFDPLTVETDAARFQYKAEGDAEGVTGRLQGVERWDATASGKAILFEDADGHVIVADGHQRRGLARRLAEQGWKDAQLDGYLFRARDGWTAPQVRVVAALKNIREGSGQIMDAAKLFREAPGALRDRSLPVTGEFIQQARQLASLSDGAFKAVVNGVVPERYAAIVGEQAASRPDLHDDLVELLRRADPRSTEGARAMVQEGMLDDFIKAEGMQTDLFGGLPRESTVIARGRIREAVMSSLRRDAKLNAALVRHADAIETGGNVLARTANEKALAIDRAASELVSRLALRSGEMGEAFGLAASAVTKGETTPGAAAKGLVARIRAAVAAGERMDAERDLFVKPKAPSPAALDAAKAFDEPAGAGQRAQIADKPEDIDVESEAAQNGLFDDIPETVSEDRALSVLKACAPGSNLGGAA